MGVVPYVYMAHIHTYTHTYTHTHTYTYIPQLSLSLPLPLCILHAKRTLGDLVGFIDKAYRNRVGKIKR
jgi:hypothetical protein